MRPRVPYHFILRSLLLLLLPVSAYATAMAVAVVAEDEPARVRELLLLAAQNEESATDPEKTWQAAATYCEAARLGSIEAQYRLGMMYAFGRGVPASKPLAAALFSLAGNQGHAESQNMLESINLTSTELPPCVTSEVLPEKPPVVVVAKSAEITRIEQQLSILPDNKRWIIDLVEDVASWYAIDPKLVLSIIAVESNFQVKAQSPKAAMGLMQLIPETAERFNIKNAFDATQNVKGGIRYLRWLLAYYRGNIAYAAAAYNAGEKAVDRYKGVPPYPETREYVRRVMELYQRPSHPFDETIVAPSPLVTRSG